MTASKLSPRKRAVLGTVTAFILCGIAPADPAAAAYVSPMFPSKAYQAEAFTLSKMGLKVVHEVRCEAFVDLLLAAKASGGNDPTNQRVSDAINDGSKAACFIQLTAEDQLSYGVRTYWQTNAQQLLQTADCAKYTRWARETVFARASENERRYQLTRLYADAQAHQCMR